MKRLVILLPILALALHKADANPTYLLNYEQSQQIIADVVRSIDSIWSLEDNKIKKKVRLIDKKSLFYPTASWAFLDDKTPFVVLNKFPYDFNSSSYIDLVTIKYEIQGGVLRLTIFSLVHKECNEIPVIVVKWFELNENSIGIITTKEIRVLDDWDAFPKD